MTALLPLSPYDTALSQYDLEGPSQQAPGSRSNADPRSNLSQGILRGLPMLEKREIDQSSSRFLSLPVEIQLRVANHLDLQSFDNLTATCQVAHRRFRDTADKATAVAIDDTRAKAKSSIENTEQFDEVAAEIGTLPRSAREDVWEDLAVSGMNFLLAEILRLPGMAADNEEQA